jgi:Calcineurin-like phosphoesterase
MSTIVGARLLSGVLRGVESLDPHGGLLEAESAELPASDDLMTFPEFVAGLNRAENQLQATSLHPDVMACVEDPLASLSQSHLAERAEEAGHLAALAAGGEEATYDDNDYLGWARILYQGLGALIIPSWPVPPLQPERIGNKASIAILGDWGTGLYGAPVCADSIAKRGQDYAATIHLGDVYYSGTRGEMRKNFLKIWPSNPGALRRALIGNHEMYSGAHAYFDELLPEFKQSSSCFAIENDKWLLLGLDTGYKKSKREIFWPPDNDLYVGQIHWLWNQIEGAREKRVILLSHHQPFSYFDRQGPTLVSRIVELLESKRVFAWYWGHEHRCVLYDRHPEWGFFGRCVGHGGYPYFRAGMDRFIGPPSSRPEFRAATETTTGWRWLPGRMRDETTPNTIPPALFVDGPNPYVPGHEADYGPNGYLSLDFNGTDLFETVHAPDGTVVYSGPMPDP